MSTPGPCRLLTALLLLLLLGCGPSLAPEDDPPAIQRSGPGSTHNLVVDNRSSERVEIYVARDRAQAVDEGGVGSVAPGQTGYFLVEDGAWWVYGRHARSTRLRSLGSFAFDRHQPTPQRASVSW